MEKTKDHPSYWLGAHRFVMFGHALGSGPSKCTLYRATEDFETLVLVAHLQAATWDEACVVAIEIARSRFPELTQG